MNDAKSSLTPVVGNQSLPQPGIVWPPQAYNTTMDWDMWEESLETYFEGKDIVEAKDKKFGLLSCLGHENFSRLVKWCHPTKPRKMTYENLILKLREKFARPTNTIVARLRMTTEKQKHDQSEKEYIRHMTVLAADCGYTDEKDIVLDILRGMRNDELRKYLLEPGRKLDSVTTLQDYVDNYLLHEKTAKDLIDSGKPKSSAPSLNEVRKQEDCTRCGRAHGKLGCPAKNAECRFCKKKGHFEKCCFTKKKGQPTKHRQFGKKSYHKRANRVEQGEQPNSDSDGEGAALLKVETCADEILEEDQEEHYVPPIMMDIKLNGVPVNFQHDTGAYCSIIGSQVWNAIGKPKLFKLKKPAHGYNGSVIPTLGRCLVEAQVNGKKAQVWVTVNQQHSDALLGRTWIQIFGIKTDHVWQGSCYQIEETGELKEILEEYKDLFSKELGKCDMTIKLHLKKGAQPKFLKPRNLPYALREKAERVYEENVRRGIWKKVSYSKWGTPVVAVMKPNGDVRICGDYKCTVNPQLEVDQHPIPRIDDLFNELNGGTLFSKVDLKDAYLQFELEEDSKELTVISTHKGLFQCERLPPGISSAVAVFQEKMEQILHGIEGVVIFLDDVTVTGKTIEEHLARLREVFSRFRKHGLRLKKEKCAFLKSKIEFLGHEIDANGIRASPTKLDGIAKMPEPENLKQLEAFIGMVNYYGKFVKDLATLAAPLNELRKNDVPWTWDVSHRKAFEEIKNRLLSNDLLAHYDPSKEVVLATDASEYGIGAVIYHREIDGRERIIANASRKLQKSERNYAQIEKEALGIIYGVEKFHTYLLGRKFTLLTDHQPLLRIFGNDKPSSAIAVKRLARWAIILMNYDYKIEYRRTEDFGNADGLSRLPIPDAIPSAKVLDREEKFSKMYQMEETLSPLNLDVIREATTTDPELQQIIKWTKESWPQRVGKEWLSWESRRAGLTLGNGYLLFNDKPVIPKNLKNDILKMLHDAHVGRDRMMTIARENFWYQGMTSDIKKIARSCEVCNSCHKGQKERLHAWEKPEQFWDRVHIDYASFKDANWLIVIDAKTNWLEVERTSKIDTEATKKVLKSIFSRFGLPKQLVSDNGPAFASETFAQFCQTRGIVHTKAPPYHPQPNGEAERAVRSFKEGVEKFMIAGCKLQDAVLNTLLMNRTTKSNPRDLSPFEAVFGRSPRTKHTIHNVELGKEVGMKADFGVGDKVWVRMFNQGPRWKPGYVREVTGVVTFIVDCSGELLVRHRDHLRKADDICIYPKKIIQQEGSGKPNHANLPIQSKQKEKSPPQSVEKVRRSSRIAEKPKRKYIFAVMTESNPAASTKEPMEVDSQRGEEVIQEQFRGLGIGEKTNDGVEEVTMMEKNEGKQDQGKKDEGKQDQGKKEGEKEGNDGRDEKKNRAKKVLRVKAYRTAYRRVARQQKVSTKDALYHLRQARSKIQETESKLLRRDLSKKESKECLRALENAKDILREYSKLTDEKEKLSEGWAIERKLLEE